MDIHTLCAVLVANPGLRHCRQILYHLSHQGSPIYTLPCIKRASQVALVVKNLPAHAVGVRDAGSIPESGMSPEGWHGNPLQSSHLENPMDRGA